MSQAALFLPPKIKRAPVKLDRRAVVAPHGTKDKSGKYWHERLDAELSEKLTSDEREVALEVLLDWPASRMDAFRCILNRWVQAQPLERDNFAEAMGR